MDETTRTDDGLETPVETAAYLKVPVATLYNWKYTGRGPRYIKVGKHLRYRRSDVDRWLDAQSGGADGD
jgi:excisionase family DNA binding protein